MDAKHNFCHYIFVFVSLLSLAPVATAVTAEELADICEAMESAIVDISLEYEWYNIPPWTFEELAEEGVGAGMLISKDGIRRCKLSVAGLLSNREPNNPNFLLFNRLLLEESTTLVTQEGNSWNDVTKDSWNGKIAKRLNIGGWPREVRSGIVSHRKEFVPTLMLSPLGFSVLRLSMSRADESLPLSARLRDKEFVHLDNSIKKVNGFNTIPADFLTHTNDPNTNKVVYLRIYFSVDHGYTPIRYEHMTGGKPESNNQVALAFEVQSLEKVAKGLWFPSSGVISSSVKTRVDAFQTISKILVNQGLTDEHFDIEFPPGTKVRDEIRDLKYVVGE